MVSREFDLGHGSRIGQHDILEDAADVLRRSRRSAGEWPAERAELEVVAVQMQRMIVRALVDELQAVAAALDQRGDGRIGVRLAVDRPALHGAMAAKRRLENQRHENRSFRRFAGGRCRELLVVPHEVRGLQPARRASPTTVFDDHCHSTGLHMPADLSKDPHARVIHLDDRAHALRRRESQHRHRARSRHRIAVECHHLQVVAREGDPMHFGGT